MNKNFTLFIFIVLFSFSFGKAVSEEEESQNTPNQAVENSPVDQRTESLEEVEDQTVTEGESEEQEELFREKTSKNKSIEKFKVTGSRIRRIDFEGPNPVTVWTKEDLENSGYTSLSKFFKNTSLSNFGGTLLRNRSTLTLVNGARIVHDAGNGPWFLLLPLKGWRF